MGGFALVRGKRQTVKIDAGTLQTMAKILGIRATDQVTVISVAISSHQPGAKAAARPRPRGRAQRSTRGGSRRSSARSTRRARQK